MNNQIQIPTTKRSAAGFSLIELMIVLVVIAILASFAFSSYAAQILRSHRSDATVKLAALAQQQELFFTRNRTYTAVIAGGDGCAGAVCGLNQIDNMTPNDDFVLTAVANATSYTLTATATGRQRDDTGCRVFTINNAGVQTALDSGGADATDNCW
jgi:type IV pilus assembly protein PilE